MPSNFANYAGTELKSEAFHYSQAVKVGNLVKISGQGGWDSEGNMAPSAAKQVQLALENAERALKAADRMSDLAQRVRNPVPPHQYRRVGGTCY